jgi:hypothetical protein
MVGVYVSVGALSRFHTVNDLIYKAFVFRESARVLHYQIRYRLYPFSHIGIVEKVNLLAVFEIIKSHGVKASGLFKLLLNVWNGYVAVKLVSAFPKSVRQLDACEGTKLLFFI